MFLDSSLYSCFTNRIPIVGYIQASTHRNLVLSPLQQWMSSASWYPVLHGLASNTEFKRNMVCHEDPNDSWIRLPFFAEITLDNARLGHLEKKLAIRF
jgi:hypothetical protein